MTRAELNAVLDAARPPCHECGLPVRNLELFHYRDHLGEWRPRAFVLVCGDNHRVTLEPFDA